MFIKLTHGLHNVINAIVSYIQKWTDDSVPEGTKTVHNFKDGQGKRPAVPLDELGSGTKIESVKIGENFDAGNDEFTVSNNVYHVKLHTELGNGRDNLGSKTGITNVVCNPDPIIFTIQNDVPDKIEKIVPVKTQALPGQDYIFEIFYVKDYSYIDGDILPVFGSWGRYAKISSNGRYLTVNSDADLTVRLVLTPTPQDWIPEHPDEGAIQQPGDRQLNTIPRDGARHDFTIESSKIEDNFYIVSVENQANTFVTNSELANGTQYKVTVPNDKLTIPIKFAEGFDENAIYWKCYDDPKGLTPAQGYYVQKDFNADFEPISDPIYRKAQYIYSNGYCYIDTGYKLKAGDKVKILASINEYSDNSFIPLFGCRTTTAYGSSTSGAYNAFVRFNGYRNICFERNNQVKWDPTYTTKDYSLIHSDAGNPFIFISDGVSMESQTISGVTKIRQAVAASHDVDTTLNCYLFTVNQNGSPYGYGARGYFYRVEIFDSNDNVIMRLIPVYNTVAKMYGMYDLVSNKFFTNKRSMQAFSGALFYGWQKDKQCSNKNSTIRIEQETSDYNTDVELPEGYDKLYGIYMKGGYVNTNYKIKKNDRVEVMTTVDNNTGASYRCLFGARQGSFTDDNYFFFTRFNGSNTPCYGKLGKETTGSNFIYGVPIKVVSEANKVSWYRQDVLTSSISVTGTAIDCRYVCYIGCGNNAGSVDSYCYAKYHYFKIFDENNNLILNYVPAKRLSDNELGFYDTVSNTFIRRAGGAAFEIAPYDASKHYVIIENIHSDLSFGMIRNPQYDNPFKLEDCEPIDCLEHGYELIGSNITDYFWVVNNTNSATDYATFNTSYNVVNCGNDTTFTLTYKQGYDNYDVTCTANKGANVEVGKTHYITYNELDIPTDYSVIPGLYSNNSNTYFKTGYIPEGEDKVVCYCSITRDSWPSYPGYVFGARNGVNNKSFVFYAHRSGDNRYNTGYDRCCGETNIRDNINNELLKITADMNGCEVDYAYTKTKINTTLPTTKKYDYQDYNNDVVLPNSYTKLSCISKKQTSKAYIDLGLVIKPNYKVEAITHTNTPNTKSNIVLFGSASRTNMVIAEQTATVFTYPMRYDTNNNYWVNTNQNKNSTNSELEFKMKEACTLVLNVTQSSEVNYDFLIILKNGTQVTTTQGLSGARTIQLSNLAINDIIKIYYKKDGSSSSGTDTATVQIVCNDIIVNSEFIGGIDTAANILYTKYNSNNAIALKQENIYTNNNFIYNGTAKIKMDGTKISWRNYNDELVAEMPYTSSSDVPIYNTYLFGSNINGTYVNYGGAAKLYIYSFKIYDEEDNLIYHLIPAQKKNNNEYGLYDIVTDTFFTNAGDDSFDGHEIVDDIYYGGEDCEYEMYIFSCDQANSKQAGYYGNMYKFTIYNDEGRQVVNLVPVKRNSDNVLGFYDTVRQKFITPSGGAVSQAAVPTYKSYLKVTNITDDTTVTMVKNNSNRKELVIDSNDALIHGYDLLSSNIKDYFFYVKYNNNAGNVCSLTAPISTYYNTVNLPNTTTRFPVTYKRGRDDTDIEAISNNQAQVEIGEALHIVYDIVPDEYFIIPGLYSSSSNTYFNIDYIPKAHDKVTCYTNIASDNYTYYLFGVDDGEGRNSCVLCTRYTSDNSNFYFDRCKRLNCSTLPKNEVIKIDGDYTGFTCTNGYDTYNYPLTGVTPTDCTRNIYVFGSNNNGTRRNAVTATIYKFTISDEYGVKLNLIPVKRKIDNVLGFYDTIGNRFYIVSGGSVTEAAIPSMKGGIYVSNITEDTEITVTEKQKQRIEIGDSLAHDYNLEKATLEDYWYYININNLTNGKISFNNQVYTNYYTCLSHENIDMSVTYAAGYDNNNFLVSEGQLTNAAWKLTNVSDNKLLTIMLNDYHDPICQSNDDLGIFTDTDFGDYNQYIIIEGNDIILSKYTLINSQASNMIQRDVYEFNTDNIDLIGWNPANVPGEVQAKNVCPDSNIDEVITNITVDGIQLYKHVFTLRNQIKLETGKQYIFKVRNSQDQRMLIACAKDTTNRNLVNSNNEMYILDNKLYFGWNESNKYIVTGNMSIYFEINGVKQ